MNRTSQSSARNGARLSLEEDGKDDEKDDEDGRWQTSSAFSKNKKSTRTTAISTSSTWTGSEPFLVGLSPSYWAHVPLNIIDVINLKLVNGINCLQSTKRRGKRKRTSASLSSITLSPEEETNNSVGNVDDDDVGCDDNDVEKETFIPVSKCTLVGVIVSAEVRSDGSKLYVLDDGTGLMDCVDWSSSIPTSYDNRSQNIFQLPSLFSIDPVEDEQNLQRNRRSLFEIGDLVQVLGKINCLHREESATTRTTIIVREIKVTMMDKLEYPSTGICSSYDPQTNHWIQACNFLRSIDKSPEKYTPQGILESCGPDIASQVAERRYLPSADDTIGAWRVFGISCHCKLSYMDELLYCHCQAKVESLDPHFAFRDTLLHELLRMQQKKTKKLVFTYQEIKTNEKLQRLAVQQVSKNQVGPTAVSNPKMTTAGTTTTTLNGRQQRQKTVAPLVDRTFRNTFRALRHDGIIYLMDADSDNYLLITRGKVLEPFVRRQQYEQRANKKPSASSEEKKDESSLHSKKRRNRVFFCLDDEPYLSKVHLERLAYINASLGC